MISNRQRLRARLERVESNELRALLNECLAIASIKASSSNVPRKKYRDAISRKAADYGEAPEHPYAELSDEELRRESDALVSRRQTDNQAATPAVRFERLELQNFGSFYGKHEIDLRAKNDRRVTVFVGDNGTGKSTTFTAINWSLYGDVVLGDGAHTKGAPKDRVELVNDRCKEEAGESKEVIETSATIVFTAEGESYRVTRKFTTHILDGGASPGEAAVYIHRVEQSGNYTELYERDLASILRTMPTGVREFYLFDGDRINQFTAPDSPLRIRNAIQTIVGMDQLNDVVTILRDAEKGIRNEQDKADQSDKMRDALLERDRIAEELENSDRVIRQGGEDKISLEDAIRGIDHKLAQTATTSGLQARRSALQKELSDNAGFVSETLGNLRKQLHGTFEALAVPALAELRSDLTALHEAGELIPGISPQYVAELLEETVCICGRPLSEHQPEAVNHLTEFLSNFGEAYKTESRVLNVFYEVPTLIKELCRRPEALIERHRQYSTAWEKSQSIKGDLDQISDQIGGLEEVNREGWESERRRLKSQLENLFLEVAREQVKLDELKLAKASNERSIKSLTTSKGRAQELNREHGWATAALTAMEAIVSEFSTIARMEAAHRTQALWNQLLPNVGAYSVEIGPDYGIDVRNAVGEKGLTQLSAGQRQCLGLAFITSIAHVAETLPPLVIDVPFGKLSSEVAGEVARSLPSLTSQLVLFLLPGTEWNETTQTTLAHEIGRTVHLVQDEHKGSHFEVRG